MKYFLKQMVLGTTVALSLEKKQFEQLKLSRNILLSAKAIEEKYDLLIANFLEFEKEILTQVAQQMILSEHSYENFYDLRIVLNRRVVNLLTSTKLYSDQIEKHVRICLCNENTSEKVVKPYFSEEYDLHLEYRFMEALRNYVQHYGLAVHSLSLPSNWVENGENKEQINTIKLSSSKEELSKDKSFKKKTLSEIDDKTDLVKSTRVYVGSFSKVHQKIRDLIETNVIAARYDIENTIERYKNVNSERAVGLYAYSILGDNPREEPIEKFPILLDWDNVRVRLTNKNRAFPNISQWYVTSRCL